MYISLYTTTNRPLILSLIAAIKKQFSQLTFILRDVENRGLQLQLLDNALEDRPVAFVQGFIAAWELREKKGEQHQEVFNEERMP